jgi:transposase-like protein
MYGIAKVARDLGVEPDAIYEWISANQQQETTSARTKRGRPYGWDTRFARLVHVYGVAKLARDLEVEQTAIYQWIRGSTSPRPEKAMTIILLLRPVGRLRLEDIYHHRLRAQAISSGEVVSDAHQN